MAVQVISFRCVLKNQLGQVISSTFNQDVLTHSQSRSEKLNALGEALQNLRKGEKRRVCLRADQAYGYYRPELVITRRLEQLDMSEPVQVGERIIYDSNGKRGLYRVISVTADSVTLDGNHPLAGQDLVFEIEATAAREATPEEIEDEESASQVSTLN